MFLHTERFYFLKWPSYFFYRNWTGIVKKWSSTLGCWFQKGNRAWSCMHTASKTKPKLPARIFTDCGVNLLLIFSRSIFFVSSSKLHSSITSGFLQWWICCITGQNMTQSSKFNLRFDHLFFTSPNLERYVRYSVFECFIWCSCFFVLSVEVPGCFGIQFFQLFISFVIQ